MIGCIIAALLGMATVIWYIQISLILKKCRINLADVLNLVPRYALGGALDEEELQFQVAEAIAKKEARGSKTHRAKKMFRLAKK